MSAGQLERGEEIGAGMDLGWGVAIRGQDEGAKLLPGVAAKAKTRRRKIKKESKVAMNAGFIFSY